MQNETETAESAASTTLQIAAPESMLLLERFDSFALSRLSITYRKKNLFNPGGRTVAWILDSDREEGTSADSALDVALRRALAALRLTRGPRDGEEATRT